MDIFYIAGEGEYHDELSKLTINTMRWYTFICYSLRSMALILITSVKNIYDSYHIDQSVLIPPDPSQVKFLEDALHVPVAVDYIWKYLEEQSARWPGKVNQHRMLALYMDIRCYDNEIKKQKNQLHSMVQSGVSKGPSRTVSQDKDTRNTEVSAVSNISFELEGDYLVSAKAIAIDIFDEYLRTDSKSEVMFDENIKISIFMKFGCEYKDSIIGSFTEVEEPVYYIDKFHTDVINEETLHQNLNQFLFHELYMQVLDCLEEAYDDFKESVSYKVLLEDIRRQEKLYEVLMEGNLVVDY